MTGGAILRVVGGVLLVLALAGCTGSSLKLASASATTPYRGTAGEAATDPGNADYGVTPDPSMPITIATPRLDPNHTYSLPELINIAQLSNPATQAAWQRAREAAAATGIAEGAYLPIISADVLAGYAVTSNTAPGINTALVSVPDGTITTSGMQAVPSLAVKWLLFDFGARDAALATAQQVSFAANVGFNGTHQKLIYDVSNAYFQYSAARAQSRIDRAALDNARVVLEAAQARLDQGVATTMEVAQAKQQVAQAEFDLTGATGRERSTYAMLLGAMGVSPTITIKVQDISGKPLPRQVPDNLDQMIVASLQRRPDVQAAFAQMKASEQGIAAARAEFLPRIALTGTINRTIGSYSIHDTRFDSTASLDVNQPNAAVLLGVTVPIFDGGMRDARMEAAVAAASASQQDFARLQSTAAQEIVVAYDVLRTSLSANAAATELVNAARTNYEAALDYYKNGLGTLADISVTQTGLLKAQYAQAQARSDAFVAAATLAFATGTLTSANSF
ncbi:TolC family protein [Devosia ginsengisoli]|uniref:Protein CyaE n=1 Tax=Devosia ginsengisoli TaxID=400770 RepID=A0A5B8LY87_9HYPH|nr:TolC family protein [Devosia ginsengisoli]QDZ12495.1 TolC family protein [Devosia ginsengisoli]